MQTQSHTLSQNWSLYAINMFWKDANSIPHVESKWVGIAKWRITNSITEFLDYGLNLQLKSDENHVTIGVEVVVEDGSSLLLHNSNPNFGGRNQKSPTTDGEDQLTESTGSNERRPSSVISDKKRWLLEDEIKGTEATIMKLSATFLWPASPSQSAKFPSQSTRPRLFTSGTPQLD
ncbi:hypothetical protein L1987_09219 [Smallanthus sonchifolius]|uniref:Uncharacterized protein n=1 Tax=Smallanthus sonchifolius TaxID=185202 RepID=A0ACB9JP89_9ASTR|nr:hypothetical protein L1987_09219 [Smallanthus sonchifolius]